ncbi:MAG: ThiF family adenylyltransferase, partial [Acidobacteriota bacterium]|nr:ThiF family adenylyltransferase [Acidobacteriota bacterium]
MNERYSRQILFREIGKDGQEKLLDSRVLLVGCGALGASHAEMLARAGVGHLRVVDRDFVEFTNLQRQTLFSEQDAKERLPKAI